MVGITYTGIDGKTTRFNSDSASGAMERLKSIKGYNGTVMDSAAAELAGAFASRHKNAARVASLDGVKTFRGSTGVFTSSSGRVSRIPSVMDVRLENGGLTVRRQDRFVGEDGRTVSTGNVRTERIKL